jgi:hypothetical protein
MVVVAAAAAAEEREIARGDQGMQCHPLHCSHLEKEEEEEEGSAWSATRETSAPGIFALSLLLDCLYF